MLVFYTLIFPTQYHTHTNKGEPFLDYEIQLIVINCNLLGYNMGYELAREEKSDCGCVTEYYEHDFWSSSRDERTTYCPRHLKEHQEEQRLREERYRQEEKERQEIRRLEEERRRQKEEEYNCLVKEFKKIATETRCRVLLSEIVPDLSSKNRLIRRRSLGFGPLLNLEKVKNRWMCNKEATLFYMGNMKKLEKKK